MDAQENVAREQQRQAIKDEIKAELIKEHEDKIRSLTVPILQNTTVRLKSCESWPIVF